MSAPMYLRIKRQNQTYFILCQPQDTIGFLKEQISIANKDKKQIEITPNQMRLIVPAKDTNKNKNVKKNSTSISPRPPPKAAGNGMLILEDDAETLETHHLENEMELHVVFQISDQEWEAVTIDSLGQGGGMGSDAMET